MKINYSENLKNFDFLKYKFKTKVPVHVYTHQYKYNLRCSYFSYLLHEHVLHIPVKYNLFAHSKKYFEYH